ncbi:unnamed protein product [Blumeria hordei]|uniref:Autophagy protein 5 n=1 Tax=Blumeria hordei TaxID=2867405 RepID=A0A383UXT4_BLUHO|nr:unnamed protein product [Blumeria hordei]
MDETSAPVSNRPAAQSLPTSLQSYIWHATLPLAITHASSAVPYLLHVPRLSYLPLILPRLNLFFGPGTVGSSFSHRGRALPNLPIGLLCDIFAPPLPWALELGSGPVYETHDTFINSLKEADFVRNGTARGVLAMSKEDSKQLWHAIIDNDFDAFRHINRTLLNPPSRLKHIPIRLYLPPPPLAAVAYQAVQQPITPETSPGEVQTLGSALALMLPSLFQGSIESAQAEPILHGAPVPLYAPLEELMREAAYADGWLHICIRLSIN